MGFIDFISRFFSPKKGAISRTQLDTLLMRKVLPRRWPNLSQIKYINRFLEPKERRLFVTFLAIAGLSVVIWFGVFIFRHSTWTAKTGGDYVEAMIGQPRFINPLFAPVNDVDTDLSALIYSSLLKYDQNMELTTDLAESFKVSNDLKTYDVVLKQNLRWSDGEPISVDDVIFTIESAQNIETASPLVRSFDGVKLEKTGPFSLRLTIKEPFAPFLSTLTVGILPKHIWSEIAPASISLSKYNLKPIGSGPWKFDKMVKDDSGTIQSYTLVPNEYYYANRPYLKSFTAKFFNNYSEVISALKGQAANAASFIPRGLQDKVTSKNLNTYTFYTPQYTALFFNQTRRPELKDKDVRLALSYTIDREALVKSAMNNEAKTADSVIPNILPEYKSFNPTFSPTEASKLLDKNWKRIQPEEYFSLRRNTELASYKSEIEEAKNASTTDPNIVSSTLDRIEKEVAQKIRGEMPAEQTYYRKDSKNNILSLTISAVDSPEYIQIANTVAEAWRAIGIQTNIEAVNSYQLSRDTLKNRSYDVLLYGEIVGGDLDLYAFWHSSQINAPGLNLAGYSNRNADKILEDARTTMDKSTRSKLYSKLAETINADLPAIILFNPGYMMVADKSIKGLTFEYLPTPSDRYRLANNWYVKTGWGWK